MTESEKEIFISGKRAGAKSFAKLVKQMRTQQKMYFQTMDKDRLKKAKELEERVDRSVEVILK